MQHHHPKISWSIASLFQNKNMTSCENNGASVTMVTVYTAWIAIIEVIAVTLLQNLVPTACDSLNYYS